MSEIACEMLFDGSACGSGVSPRCVSRCGLFVLVSCIHTPTTSSPIPRDARDPRDPLTGDPRQTVVMPDAPPESDDAGPDGPTLILAPPPPRGVVMSPGPPPALQQQERCMRCALTEQRAADSERALQQVGGGHMFAFGAGAGMEGRKEGIVVRVPLLASTALGVIEPF